MLSNYYYGAQLHNWEVEGLVKALESSAQERKTSFSLVSFSRYAVLLSNTLLNSLQSTSQPTYSQVLNGT